MLYENCVRDFAALINGLRPLLESHLDLNTKYESHLPSSIPDTCFPKYSLFPVDAPSPVKLLSSPIFEPPTLSTKQLPQTVSSSNCIQEVVKKQQRAPSSASFTSRYGFSLLTIVVPSSERLSRRFRRDRCSVLLSQSHLARNTSSPHSPPTLRRTRSTTCSTRCSSPSCSRSLF